MNTIDHIQSRTHLKNGLTAIPWGPCLLIVSGALMTTISWQKWEDLIVDFGQQAYVAWQLSEGQVLYRDIFYIYGPLSSYVHALVFKLFGPGILILAGFNLALIAGLTIILYQLFQSLWDTRTANLTGLTFIGVFAFGQYKLGGNYNFVCAYVYELPHGIFLSFAALLQFKKYLDQPCSKRLVLVGLLTGLVFLTKPEVFIAEVTAIGIGLGLSWYLKQASFSFKSLISWVAGILAVPTLFIAGQSFYMPVTDSIHSVFGSYIFLFNPDLRALPLYQWILGLNDPWTNLGKMFLYFTVLGIFLIAVYGMNRIWNRHIQKYLLGFSVATCLLIAYAILSAPNVPWLSLGRPLPLMMLALGIYLLVRIFKYRNEHLSQTLGQFVLVIFALVLLFKMFLNAHVYHYGFALALPATLLVVAFLVHELPLRLQPALGSVQFYRSVTITLVLVFVGYHAWFTGLIYELKNYPVGKGRDLVIDYDRDFNNRGEIVNLALNYIDSHFKPDTDFATFPDGVMLNYLARRKHSTADITLNPGVWLLAGDGAVLKRLQQAAPPYIVYMDREFPYFGLDRFGKDFAQNIDRWIRNHYSLEAQFGAPPFEEKGFGIQILKRNQT